MELRERHVWPYKMAVEELLDKGVCYSNKLATNAIKKRIASIHAHLKGIGTSFAVNWRLCTKFPGVFCLTGISSTAAAREVVLPHWACHCSPLPSVF